MATGLAYILPTRNRPDRLGATLERLGALDGDAHARIGGAEVIVIDNASDTPAQAPESLDNGLQVRVIRRPTNEGAAARNHGVRATDAPWVCMLDDDSHPLGCGHLELIARAPSDVGAIGAEITLASGTREAGGLPEVIIGCGALIRREAFLDAGGYDPAFHYYAEEYDLCAKLLLAGLRVAHDRRFRVRHEKTGAGRDMGVILRRLVRNNGWVAQRYAPNALRRAELRETVTRYRRIAKKERARRGYAIGLAELAWTLRRQRRTPMDRALYNRFTGLAHARRAFEDSPLLARGMTVSIVEPGKNAWCVAVALAELGIRVTEDPGEADALVVGTLSPGPMLDAWDKLVAAGEAHRAVPPWRWAGEQERATREPAGSTIAA
ncbi:MAG: glycosyltransferase family 2 protein [Phycisphaerales bacterium]